MGRTKREKKLDYKMLRQCKCKGTCDHCVKHRKQELKAKGE